MSHRRPTDVEEKIDEIVTAEADLDDAWEPPIHVSPKKKKIVSERRNMAFQQHAYETLEEWAGATYPNLTLLFTDIVDSTKIGVALGDHKWIKELFVHFSRARELATQFDCYVVKSIGDAFMVAFRNAPEAILFALEFSADTGVDYIGIRVGINSGFVQIRENEFHFSHTKSNCP
jgi:class 3 adenylate cyclase